MEEEEEVGCACPPAGGGSASLTAAASRADSCSLLLPEGLPLLLPLWLLPPLLLEAAGLLRLALALPLLVPLLVPLLLLSKDS